MNIPKAKIVAYGIALALLGSATSAAPQPAAGQTIELQAQGAGSAKIAIAYDHLGTPHVKAGSEAAGYAGLCYAVAKDRLFQMEISRRSAQGRLSEIFGAGPGNAILGQDQMFRALGLVASASAHFAASSPHTQSVLRACAVGVEWYRQAIADGRSPLPREFADLGGFIPEPWAAEDGMLMGVFLQTSLDLPTWQSKLTMALLNQTLGAGLAATLVPPPQGGSLFDAQGKLNPPGHARNAATGPGSVAAARSPSAKPGTLAGPFHLPGAPMGPNLNGWRASNNFAVGGRLTATGKPIIANDPHLMLAMPSMFYQAQLKVDGGVDVAGLIIPGLPVFLIGHNQAISWVITYGMIDSVDLYQEVLQGPAVKYRGLFVPLWTRTEWFFPAGGEPVSLNVSRTPHGPLLNSAVPSLDAFGPLAVKSVVAQPQWTLDGWFDLPAAKDWRSFSQALARESIGLNVLYADSQGEFGHIGYRQTGLAPQRPRANTLTPVRGDDGSGEWSRYARYDELASVFDPPTQVLVTANNRIVPDDGYAPKGEPVYLSRWWDEPWRAWRAQDLLSNAPAPLTVDAVAKVQLDQTPFVGRALAQRLADSLARAGLPTGDADAAYALAKLQSFDGKVAADSAAAAVFELLSALLARDVFQAVLGSELYPVYAKTIFYTGPLHTLIDLLDHPRPPFFGAASSADAAAARDLAVKNALAETDGLLRHALGADHSAWTWGGLHTLTLNHPMAALDPVFALPSFPTGGDPATLDTGGWYTNIGLLALPASQLDDMGGVQAAFAQDGLASARTVMDTADFTRSLWVNSTGSSGDPLSPHWTDQLTAWRNGTYFRVPFQ